MNRQPNLALSIEDAPEVAPRDGKVGSRLDGLQVASLSVARQKREPFSAIWEGATGSETALERAPLRFA